MMNQKNYKFCVIITMFVCFLSNAQTKSPPVYVITPEINKKIIEKNPSLYDVHHIKKDKIKYRIYEPAELITYEYKQQEKLVANYEPGFDKSQKEFQNAYLKKEELNDIITKIISFLESKDKYDLKKGLLIDAQKIADKYEIKIRTKIPSSSIFEANTYDREILIYRENKYVYILYNVVLYTAKIYAKTVRQSERIFVMCSL